MVDLDHIFIHKDSENSELAQRVRKAYPASKISRVSERPLKEKEGELSAEDFSSSKRLLYLTPFRGQFFKRCPGARPGLTCCNYFVLNLGLQCNMNCSYCYLQSFINSPVMEIYTNIEDALVELRQIGKTHGQSPLRVGTGEVIDSLSLDPLTLYSRQLIGFFRDYPNWRLEFKTKSKDVDQFLDVEHLGNVICSWSINPQAVIEGEEHGTASLEDRLSAARKAKEAGFLISFHIDPMIWFETWEEHYAGLVDKICESFTPEDMPYISVGGLRFQPSQRHMMRERFGLKSFVTSAEVFPGADGKLRYDRLLRNKMFQFVIERFRKNSKDWNIFLCMETPETWLSTHHERPGSSAGLKPLFQRIRI